MGLFFEVESLDIRSPAVVLPAERYFADTAAKISLCRTLTPRYTRCSGSGVRARAASVFIAKKSLGLRLKILIRPNLVNATLTEYFRAKLLSDGRRAKLEMNTELH